MRELDEVLNKVLFKLMSSMSFVWCTNTIIGEVAVEAIQMKVHSDVSVQMTLGHGTNVN
jgi:hypothetical protein